MIFYRSFYEALRDLDSETKAILYDAIFSYGLDFQEPELKGIAKTVFTLIRPQLDANIRKFQNGKTGGRPLRNEANKNQTETKQEPNINQNKSKAKANDNANANVNENINANANDNEKVEALPPPPEHSLVTWIKKHTPRVHKLKKPLTNEEAERLIADLDIGKNERGEMLKGILMSMENYAPLLSKSVSANLTIRKWWKMEEERMASSKPKQAEETFVPRTEIYYK